jgi:hypothetical protein
MIMENNEGGKTEALSPQEETAKAAILAECDKFAKAGITFVAAHFDGYGDSGTTEVRCYDSESYAWGEDETVNHDVSYLEVWRTTSRLLSPSDTRMIAVALETWYWTLTPES